MQFGRLHGIVHNIDQLWERIRCKDVAELDRKRQDETAEKGGNDDITPYITVLWQCEVSALPELR